MGKLVFYFLFFVIPLMIYGQENPSPSPISEQEYLQKSKNQKTAAWILLGSGATLCAIAAPGNINLDILPIIVVAGTAAVLGSIPLFIASGKNKRKANITTYFEIQRIPGDKFSGPSESLSPGISVKLNF